MDIYVIFLRFMLVFLSSLLFGLERQRSHKPTGFGTFIFVAIGSCALAMIPELRHLDEQLPILGAIVTGIGFLGAGALIKTSDKIFGLTTAASIWIFAIIGLMIGLGEYLVGFAIYFFIWIVILIDRYLENKGIGSYQKKVTIKTTRNITSDDLSVALRSKKYKIMSIDVNIQLGHFIITLLLEGTKADINSIPKSLFKVPWVESFKIE